MVDHNAVANYDKIPAYYINLVKKMWINIPGESHSSGYRKGLTLLNQWSVAQGDTRFAVSVKDSGAPEAYTDQYLRVGGSVWFGSSWIYGAGEALFYANTSSIQAMKNHLTYANTHGFEIAAFGFGWCWDMTWGNAPGGTIDPVFNVHWAGTSDGGPDGNLRWGLDDDDYALTGNRVSMKTYLDAVEEYIAHIEDNGYSTVAVFTTGPVDGYSGENGYQRHLKHEYIRQHVYANQRVLFDYADILSYNNAGQIYTTSWNGNTYPMIHPDNMMDYDANWAPIPHVEDGDHIGKVGAMRLGKAQWWMLARLAGWDGNPEN
jgi:hypothetical protein